MSSSRQFALCALLALVFVDNAFAYPQIRAGLSGSWLLAYASNSEGKSFTCNYYYEVAYSDFGEAKQASSSGSFGVSANANNQLVLKVESTWVQPRLVAWNVSGCT